MYAVTSMPLDRRTRATLRRAEFGFLGVWVNTRVHTPRRWGAPLTAGVFTFDVLDWRPLRASCWIVGTRNLADDGCRGLAGGDRPRRAHVLRPTGHPRGRHAPTATCGAERGRATARCLPGERCQCIPALPASGNPGRPRVLGPVLAGGDPAG